jgi:hypothetical protein
MSDTTQALARLSMRKLHEPGPNSPRPCEAIFRRGPNLGWRDGAL